MITLTIGLGGHRLYQLPNQSGTQMMSYLIATPQGGLVAVDGGTQADAPYLRRRIRELGGRVDAWLITHAHYDHVGAMNSILEDPQGIRVEKLYSCIPSLEWLIAKEPRFDNEFREFFAILESARGITAASEMGKAIRVPGLEIQVLNDLGSGSILSDVNASSILYQCRLGDKRLLFLGDLNKWRGDFLLQKGVNFRSEIVQMAHHGQNGVGENVYRAIRPDVCLWPTPRWLWENDLGGGPDTGPFKTMETRGWMEKMGVRHHAVMMDGEYELV